MSHSSIEMCLKSSSLAASFLRMPGGFEKNVIHFDKTAKVMSDWDDRNRWSHKITAVSNCLDRNHWNHVFFDGACVAGHFRTLSKFWDDTSLAQEISLMRLMVFRRSSALATPFLTSLAPQVPACRVEQIVDA